MWRKLEKMMMKKRKKCTINGKRNVVDSGYKREEPGASSIYYDYV
jgi:hypothetical protein